MKLDMDPLIYKQDKATLHTSLDYSEDGLTSRHTDHPCIANFSDLSCFEYFPYVYLKDSMYTVTPIVI